MARAPTKGEVAGLGVPDSHRATTRRYASLQAGSLGLSTLLLRAGQLFECRCQFALLLLSPSLGRALLALARRRFRCLERLRSARAKYEEGLATELRRMARAWSEADVIRRFVAAVRDAIPAEVQTGREAEWLRWADRLVSTLDPLA
jgi:hypothetical protein